MAKKQTEDPNQLGLWGSNTFYTSTSTVNYNYIGGQEVNETSPTVEETTQLETNEGEGLPHITGDFNTLANSFLNEGKPEKSAVIKEEVPSGLGDRFLVKEQPNKPPPKPEQNPLLFRKVEPEEKPEPMLPLDQIFQNHLNKGKNPPPEEKQVVPSSQPEEIFEEVVPEVVVKQQPVITDEEFAEKGGTKSLLDEFLFTDDNKNINPMPRTKDFCATGIKIATGLDLDFFIRRDLSYEGLYDWMKSCNSDGLKWRLPLTDELFFIVEAIRGGRYTKAQKQFFGDAREFDLAVDNRFWLATSSDVRSYSQTIRLLDVINRKYLSVGEASTGCVVLVRNKLP